MVDFVPGLRCQPSRPHLAGVEEARSPDLKLLRSGHMPIPVPPCMVCAQIRTDVLDRDPPFGVPPLRLR
jgi:hypothetical protein